MSTVGGDTDRREAIVLVLAAFAAAAEKRGDTPVTNAEGRLALRTLGVAWREIREAQQVMGQRS